MYNKLLSYVLRRPDVIILCTAAITLNVEFYFATRTSMSHDFIDGAFAFATFGFCSLGYVFIRLSFDQFPFGCVSREVFIVGTRIFVDALAT